MAAVGLPLNQEPQGGIDRDAFARTDGCRNRRDFVIELYANVLHRARSTNRSVKPLAPKILRCDRHSCSNSEDERAIKALQPESPFE
jgi:hypothetical protein